MKTKILFILFLLFFTFSTAFFSCKDEGLNNIDDVVIPQSNVSYNKYIQPVFDFKCNFSGCHDDASAKGGLRLTSHTNTTAGYRVLIPFEPDNSIIVQRVEGRSFSPMPPVGYKPMTSDQIRGLRTWIKEGAKNN